MRPLPDSYAIRPISLPPGVGEQIREYPDGHIDIFVNAGWGADAQRDAVEHALEHWANDDFHSEGDIREIEARADRRDGAPKPEPRRRPIRRDMSGARMASPPPVFSLFDLERVGRGLYLPTGRNLDKVHGDLTAIRRQLDEAVLTYDVMQRPPLIPRDAIGRIFARFADARASFIGWAPRDGTTPRTAAMLHMDSEGVEASVYYAPDGVVDGVHARLDARHDGRGFTLLVTLSRCAPALRLSSILRSVDGGEFEMIYGGY